MPYKSPLNLTSNYHNGIIYLDNSDLRTNEYTYIYFLISDGSINSYAEYTYSNKKPIYEEEFSISIKVNFYYNTEPNCYTLHIPKDENFPYLLIKYSRFYGKSLSIIYSYNIDYLQKDNWISIYRQNSGYIYLRYKDFSYTDDYYYLYLHFKLYSGNMSHMIYYNSTDIIPIYKEKTSDWNSSYYIKKDDENKNFLYRFEKINRKFIAIYYSGFTGDTLIINSLSKNPIPSFLPCNKTIILPKYTKSGFIYFDFLNFTEEDEIYIYFQTNAPHTEVHVSYMITSENPKDGFYYSSQWDSKGYDKKDDSKIPFTHSYKFSKLNIEFLVINYSWSNGLNLFDSIGFNVTCSTEDPLGKLSTGSIILIVLGSIFILVLISVIIYKIYKGKSRKGGDALQNLPPNNQEMLPK